MQKSELEIFAKMAQAAYLELKPGKIAFKELGYKVDKFYDIGGAEAYLVSNKEHRVLAFRGTEPKEKSDLLADLESGKNLEGTGKVHVGFKKYLNLLWPSITADISASKSKLPMYVTGHSLGGAMATLAAGRLLASDYLDAKPVALITFGSPRVGNAKYVNGTLADLTHYRVHNTNDAVPRVPTRWMGFRHQGTHIYLNYYGNIRNFHGWQLVKDQLRGRWKAIQKRQWFSDFYDHSMVNYVWKLNTPNNPISNNSDNTK
jgi:triacylglycerol lipase